MNIYDYGQWYRFEFCGFASGWKYIKEYVYTQDDNYGKNPDVVSTLKSKGYDRYYCSPRTNGEWVALIPYAPPSML